MSAHMSFYEEVCEAAEVVRARLGSADIAVVLGSGLSNFSSVLADKKELPYHEIPHMPLPTVAGHAGKLILGTIGDKKVLCFSGRAHPYEGIPFREVCFSVRLVAALGMKTVILTNAAGGAGEGMHPGCFMIIRDHVRMARADPLTELALGGNFVDANPDTTSCWSERLAEVARKASEKLNIHIFEGTYCWSPGPTYETAFEVSTGVHLGCNVFGMSTVPEVLVAKALGLEVFGLSVITNLAAGITEEKLVHDDVKFVAEKFGHLFQDLVRQVVEDCTVAPATPPTGPILTAEVAKEMNQQAALYQTLSANSNKTYTPDEISSAALHIAGLVPAKDAPCAAVFVSAGHESIIDSLSNRTELALCQIPSFAPSSISGHSGKVVIGTTPQGTSVLCIYTTALSGFAESESVFFALLFRRLNISNILTTAVALTEGEASPLALATDILNLSMRRPVDFFLRSHTCAPGHISSGNILSAPSIGLPSTTAAFFEAPCIPSLAEIHMAKIMGAPSVSLSTLNPIYTCRMVGLTCSLLVSSFPLSFTKGTGPVAERARSQLTSVDVVAAVESWVKTVGGSATTPLASLLFTPRPLPPLSSRNFVVQDEHSTIVAEASAHIKSLAADQQIDFIVFDADSLLGCAFKDQLVDRKDIDLSTLPHASTIFHSCSLDMIKASIGKIDGRLVVYLAALEPLSSLHNTDLVSRVVTDLKPRLVLLVSSALSCDHSCPVNSVGLIRDHTNWLGINPLRGKNVDRWGPRFPDMSEVYTNKARAELLTLSEKHALKASDVKAMWTGSNALLSPAEVAAFAKFGAKVIVGAAVPPAIIARHMSTEAASIAIVTKCALSHTSGEAEAPFDATTVLPKAVAVVSEFLRSH